MWLKKESRVKMTLLKTHKIWIYMSAPLNLVIFLFHYVFFRDIQIGWLCSTIMSLLAGLVIRNLENYIEKDLTIKKNVWYKIKYIDFINEEKDTFTTYDLAKDIEEAKNNFYRRHGDANTSILSVKQKVTE